jgi:acetoacetyl-[acyl-carrier protein] synthase
MSKLPLIVGFGGVNAAGRSSFHHSYRRLILDALGQSAADRTLQSLAALMGRPLATAEDRQHILDHTLIRRIEADWFDPLRVPLNRRFPLESDGVPVSFVTRARNLPPELPANWTVTALEGQKVRVDIHGDSDFLLPGVEEIAAKAAGQLPTGFNPGKLYPSRSHPRGLEMAIFAISDALGCLGIDWETICRHVAPDQIACYAGTAMGQQDENGNGGLLGGRYRGKRVTSKQLPFGLLDMTADFVNAYVLGNVGATSGHAGACATFLFSLRQGVDDIRAGRARVAIIGSAEAPILPDVMEGFAAMGALATDKDLLALDPHRSEPDYRRASRPFSTNCGFTIAEAAHYVVLMDDELALELGATVYGAVTDVFVNADGFKKSISSPGVGNYITVAKSMAAARAILGDEAVQRRSFIQAHGTSTPQNRVTESHILNEVAKLFGIERWPVAAIKAYLGHSMGVAPADQLVTTLGVWADGWIPGIKTIDHIADDVHASHLLISPEHKEVGREGIDVAILNAKGFGGNNASAPVLAPHIARRMLAKRHGAERMRAHAERNEAVAARARAHDEAACAGRFEMIYKFDHNVLDGVDLALTAGSIGVPGFERAVTLDLDSPFRDWL